MYKIPKPSIFQGITTRKQHVEKCKQLIACRRIDKEYLLFIAGFHGKLRYRNIVDFRFSSNGFVAVFENGIYETFSYKACLDGWMATIKGIPIKYNHTEHVIRAFRNEICPQTWAVRKSNDREGQGAEYHVGHDWENGNSFHAIYSDFLKINTLKSEDIKLTRRKMKDTFEYPSTFLEDADLAIRWREYHKSRGHGLRMELAKDNLRNK